MCYTCALYSTELQKEQQSLQEIITSLILQLREKEERNFQLTENINGILMTHIALCFIYCRSEVSEVRDLLKPSYPLLSQKLEEQLHTKQEVIGYR